MAVERWVVEVVRFDGLGEVYESRIFEGETDIVGKFPNIHVPVLPKSAAELFITNLDRDKFYTTEVGDDIHYYPGDRIKRVRLYKENI